MPCGPSRGRGRSTSWASSFPPRASGSLGSARSSFSPSGISWRGPRREKRSSPAPRTPRQRVLRALIRFKGRGALVAGIAAVAVLAILPHAIGDSGLLGSLIITLILFISVLGLDVLMGYAGQVSLCQAAFMAIGGYTAAILATDYGVSPVVGTLGGIVMSLLCAALLSLVTVRLRGAYLALATLAFGLLVDSL